MLSEIAEQAQKEISKYTENYEIYIQRTQALELDIQKDNLDFAKEEINLGIGIRVINNNSMGFAFSTDITKIDKAAEEAFQNSKANNTDKNFQFSTTHKIPKIKGLYDKKYDELELKEAIEITDLLIQTAKDNQCQPTSGGFEADKSESFILNSNGVESYSQETAFAASIAVNAEKDGLKSTAYDHEVSRYQQLDINELTHRVCELAKNSIGGVPVETKSMDVALDYHAAVGLLQPFMGALNADNVQRGRSTFANKINQEVTNPNISFYDDATIEKGLGSFNLDGEGTPAQKTTLIEDGTLKGFIYDIYTSNKDESEQKSTGNGMRSFASTPTVSTSNTVMKFKKSGDLSQITKGIYVNDVLGAHTANPISGDFSVEANNAFIIENGELKKPVKKAMLSGNIFECLKEAESFTKESKQFGSFILPKIIFKNIKVIGQ